MIERCHVTLSYGPTTTVYRVRNSTILWGNQRVRDGALDPWLQ